MRPFCRRIAAGRPSQRCFSVDRSNSRGSVSISGTTPHSPVAEGEIGRNGGIGRPRRCWWPEFGFNPALTFVRCELG